MIRNSVDAKSWGISIGLHALLLLVMIFWAAFPEIRRIPLEIELQFVSTRLPEEQPPIVDARPRVRETTTAERSSSPERRSTATVAQPAARQAPEERTTARERAPQQSAPSTPVVPREMRGGEEAVDFMDQGAGMGTRSSAPTTGDHTRRESRERGLSNSGSTSDRVTGGGTSEQPALTSDPGTLSATPHSSANIQWDGGLSRNRITGVLPSFPPGAKEELQIAIRFRVRPDGTMYGMTVIQKGDPRYERAALDAMRSWRFNALPPDVRQADQVGTAVFTFKLR